MSGFLAAALGYREFWSGDQVRALVNRRNEAAANRYQSSSGPAVEPDPRDTRLMLLFAAPTQRSWLVVDKLAVYCVLDDLRWEEPSLQLVATRSDLHAVRANRDHSPKSGILHLDPNGKDWLYSKYLFQDRDVVDAVRNFIGNGSASGDQSAGVEIGAHSSL